MALQQQKFTHVIGVRTGRFLSAQTLLQLASVPGIAGVKHAAGAIDHDTIMLMASRPDDFAVLAGDDMFASPLLALGAAGGILAAAHLCTGEFAALIAAWHSGRAGQARELGHRLAPLSAALFAEPNPAVIKGALHAQGKIPSPAVRLPLLPARQDSVRAATSLLSQIPGTVSAHLPPSIPLCEVSPLCRPVFRRIAGVFAKSFFLANILYEYMMNCLH